MLVQVWINIEFAVRKHWELFPNTRMLSQKLLDEVREIIVHASAGKCVQHRISVFQLIFCPRHSDFPAINCILRCGTAEHSAEFGE